MQIAILLYERFTALDAIGPYEVLRLLPRAELVFVGEQSGPVTNDHGSLQLVTEAALGEVPSPDIVLVPGGPGQNEQMTDGPVHQWLRAVDTTSTWTTSVCTGSLILAAAGLLTGRRATSHWLALEHLGTFGVEAISQRVVFDGKYVTAAGVSAGIDMALALRQASSRSNTTLNHPTTPGRRPRRHQRWSNVYGATPGSSSPADHRLR